MDEAEALLDDLVARLDGTREPDADLSSEIGCGDLQEFIRTNGLRLWPRVEQLARANVRFRRALRSVWAYDSPEFERRERHASLRKWASSDASLSDSSSRLTTSAMTRPSVGAHRTRKRCSSPAAGPGSSLNLRLG